jgi:hypothetical protein
LQIALTDCLLDLAGHSLRGTEDMVLFHGGVYVAQQSVGGRQ